MWEVINVDKSNREISLVEIDNKDILKGVDRINKLEPVREITKLPPGDVSANYWRADIGNGRSTRGLTIGYDSQTWPKVRGTKLGTTVPSKRKIAKSAEPEPVVSITKIEKTNDDFLTHECEAADRLRKYAHGFVKKVPGQTDQDAFRVALAYAVTTPEGKKLLEQYKAEKLAIQKEGSEMMKEEPLTKEAAYTQILGLAKAEVWKPDVHTVEQAVTKAITGTDEGKKLYLQSKEKMPDPNNWAVQKLEQIAKSIVSKDARMTYVKAFEMAVQQNPDLYMSYRSEARRA